MSHIFDMINRFNANREMLKRRNKFDYDDSLNKVKIHPDKLKKLSDKEKQKILTKIKKDKKKRIRNIVISGFTTILVFAVILFILIELFTS